MTEVSVRKGLASESADAVLPVNLAKHNGRNIVLTVSCPDTIGIVAAVSGFLASRRCLIIEAQHHDDPYTVMSFMRTVFQVTDAQGPSLAELERQFGAEVGERFGM